MALSATILNQIRDEIGSDSDYDDAALETIYVDENRGNYSILNTALIVWRRRLNDLQSRSFDVTTEGSLLARSQRIKFLERQVVRYENVTDSTVKGRNAEMVGTTATADDTVSGSLYSEFS